jgi:DNA polymerase III delta prime subunit
VFRAVENMVRNDLLLIQGPPGTGKTQTITGIVAMLLAENSGARPIKI